MLDAISEPLVQSYNQQQVQVRGWMGGSFMEVSFLGFFVVLVPNPYQVFMLA